jgi:hypothetical protein
MDGLRGRQGGIGGLCRAKVNASQQDHQTGHRRQNTRWTERDEKHDILLNRQMACFEVDGSILLQIII